MMITENKNVKIVGLVSAGVLAVKVIVLFISSHW